MSKREVLELLLELFKGAVVAETAPDDLSGLYTKYRLDQELLVQNIELALDSEPT